MFIKRFLGFVAMVFTLSGCVQDKADWYGEYGTVPTARPAQIQSGLYNAEYDMYSRPDNIYNTPPAELKTVSVMLPLTGPHAEIGRGISNSIQMAFLKNRYNNVAVQFYNLTGNKYEKHGIIMGALATEPDIIIGPVFAEDAAMVRDLKPEALPVLTFSSDTSAIGNGVMTMALIPSQSVEMIVREMDRDGATNFIVMAPKTSSGEQMAGAAQYASDLYNVTLSGIFYYDEGNSDSIKTASQRAAMYTARAAANDRAREILSDIMVKEAVTPAQKSSLNSQLKKISKSETLGTVPYNAILFLGNASDTKQIASFLRYYDVAPRDARFYGTTLWDGSELLRDYSFAGSKFASLPPVSNIFAETFESVSGKPASRLDTFGYDAANLVIGMLHSNKTPAAYLLDPSGYNGLDGLFRLTPNGASERALEIVELNGSGTSRLTKPAATDFLAPIYNINPRKITRASEMGLVAAGINPMDYIKIPSEYADKYRTKSYGANTRPVTKSVVPTEIEILPEDDSDVFDTEEFQPVTLEKIDKQFIDSVEIEG